MNILPKKRWHVRNRDNKERVRKDEENARQELQREKERIALAETEARLSLLRNKNGESKEISTVNDSHNNKEEHINLFASEETFGENLKKKDNEDYVKEKQAEKESYEKKIGLLTYLGQSAVEANKGDERPWYLKKRSKESDKKIQKKKDNSSSDDDSETEVNKKFRLDPMYTVDKVLKVKKDKKKKKKKKKEEKKSSSSSSSKSIEQLRKERLKREQSEKERTEMLLTGKTKPSEESLIAADRNRYNSQFNPHLARHKHTDHNWKPY